MAPLMICATCFATWFMVSPRDKPKLNQAMRNLKAQDYGLVTQFQHCGAKQGEHHRWGGKSEYYGYYDFTQGVDHLLWGFGHAREPRSSNYLGSGEFTQGICLKTQPLT